MLTEAASKIVKYTETTENVDIDFFEEGLERFFDVLKDRIVHDEEDDKNGK
jgi:hypothetical protein